jgi:HSP20 family protein
MRNLSLWNPIDEFQTMRDVMNRFFEDAFSNASLDTARPIAAPALDVVENEDRFEVHVNLPGISPDDVNIEFKNGSLVISAEVQTEQENKDTNYVRRERYYGTYRRSLTIPDTLDVANAQAHFENGVLTLSLPKKPESQPLRIPINGQKVIEAGKK